jgi:hypothetical protein
MFFGGYTEGRCAAGGSHSRQGYNFSLPYGVPSTPTAQAGWRFCMKCCSLFFSGYAGGRCAAGGIHSAQGSEFVLQHDMTGAASTQSNWRFCLICNGMFFERYGGGRCPVEGTPKHSAQGFNFVLTYRDDNNPPRGPGFDKKDPAKMYAAFIDNAEYYGLPVNFLKAVGKSAKLKAIADNEIQNFATWFKTLNLQQTNYEVLAELNFDLHPGAAVAINPAYHESTHAYLYLKKNDAAFKQFSAEGEKYYTDAPLQDGTKCKDPERVFQEAASTYVGDHAASWWAAFESLSRLTIAVAHGNNVKQDQRALEANKVRDKYNNVMKQPIFGYSEKGSHQVNTTRPLSQQMKQFIDTQILEDKIPDDFDKGNKLSQLYKDLLRP